MRRGPMRTLILILAWAGLSLAALAQPAERVTLRFVSATAQPGTPVALEAFVYRPDSPGPNPVVVYSHGSAAGRPRASLPARAQAQYFASRGFVVIVPMRRGRGGSSGTSPEPEEKNCDPESWAPGLQAAFEDLTAAIAHAATIDGADASRVVLAGASRGGFLSVAYAAAGERRAAAVGAINFSGGWVAQAEDQCPVDFNRAAFQRMGSASRVPMLWLYGENDPYYLTQDVADYAEVFKAAGGRLRFERVGDVPGDGHQLVSHPALWRRQVDAYLRDLATRPN